MRTIEWLAERDALRDRLTAEWRAITNNRDPRGDWITSEPRRMWEAARHVAPDSSLSFAEFEQIDATCTGHIDWFEKLVLRVAERLTPPIGEPVGD